MFKSASSSTVARSFWENWQEVLPAEGLLFPLPRTCPSLQKSWCSSIISGPMRKSWCSSRTWSWCCKVWAPSRSSPVALFCSGCENSLGDAPTKCCALCRRAAALPQPHPRAAERGVARPAAGGAGAAAAAGGRRQAAAGAGEQGVQRGGSKHWLGLQRCWAALLSHPVRCLPATVAHLSRQGLVGKAPSEMARFLCCLYTPRSARAALLEEEWGLPAGGRGRAQTPSGSGPRCSTLLHCRLCTPTH